MSPTAFIRLKYVVLASLITAAVIQQSSPFAEAAPTPSPLDLSPSLVHINSDLGLKISMISSDNDIDCELDQFASNPRCVAAPTLIRRTDFGPTIDRFKTQLAKFRKLLLAAPADKSAPLECLEILGDQVPLVEYFENNFEVSPEVREVALEAYSEYFKFLSTPWFRGAMEKMPVEKLGGVLIAYEILTPGRPHDCQLTEVVHHFLTREDIQSHWHFTKQALLIATEIANLRKHDPASGTWEASTANKYLPQFRDLLMNLRDQIPATQDSHNVYIIQETPEQMTIMHHTARIIYRYEEWEKTKDHQKAVALKVEFEGELAEPTEPLEVKTVLEAYIWLLSPDQSEQKTA
ncbi:hypothetical protein H0H93_015750 [Arthromyces matolae]|nr:hypothetical protein H0H93_015750 [Arthromyces matolae]